MVQQDFRLLWFIHLPIVKDCVLVTLVVNDSLPYTDVALNAHLINQVHECLNIIVTLCVDSQQGLLQLLFELTAQSFVLRWSYAEHLQGPHSLNGCVPHVELGVWISFMGLDDYLLHRVDKQLHEFTAR